MSTGLAMGGGPGILRKKFFPARFARQILKTMASKAPSGCSGAADEHWLGDWRGVRTLVQKFFFGSLRSPNIEYTSNFTIVTLSNNFYTHKYALIRMHTTSKEAMAPTLGVSDSGLRFLLYYLSTFFSLSRRGGVLSPHQIDRATHFTFKM